MRATEAAKNTQSIIEGNIQNIQKGFQLVVNTDESFTKVQDSSQKVAALVEDISRL